MNEKIFVTGITGQQGGAVARALKEKGFEVTGMTRSTEGDKAAKLKSEGFNLVLGDMNDKDSMVQAMKGFELAWGYTTPFEEGEDAEAKQGIILVEAAKEAGVKHFIFNSVANADKKTGIAHFDGKYKVEQALRVAGMQWTIIGPVYFMENLLFPQTMDAIKNGVYSLGNTPGDLVLQQISVANIADFVAHVAENASEFVSKRIDIAGDEITGADTAKLLSKKLGKEIKYQETPREQIAAFSEEYAIMYDWFISTGYSADLSALKSQYPEVEWQSVSDWIDKNIS